MKTIVIIPSRYASTRLPAKPLADILGMSMIERVWRRVSRAEGTDAVYVATDHPAIASEVERIGGQVVMTSPDCPSGTDRVAGAAQSLGLLNDTEDTIIINVQGDEPLIGPDVITALARTMQRGPTLLVATPVVSIRQATEMTNPNVVKAVIGRSGNALYFSRHAVPYLRDSGEDTAAWTDQYPFFKHVGVYAYRRNALQTFVDMGEGPLERAERLEQLRFLEAGIPIRCVEVEYEAVAVDTPADVLHVEAILLQRGEA